MRRIHSAPTPQATPKALTQAIASVGTRADDRARWLFAFGSRALDRDGESLERARLEVTAFIDLGLEGEDPAIPLNGVIFGASAVPPIQAAWRVALDELRKTGSTTAPRATRNSLRWVRRTGTAYRGAAGTDPMAAFFAVAFDLLERTGFRACERAKCDGFFVPVRSDQIYCSKTCRDAEAQTQLRNRATPEERSANDHEKYRRRVQRSRKQRGLIRAGKINRRGPRTTGQ